VEKEGRNPRTKKAPTEPPKAGERMLAWLSWAAELIREQAGASQAEVAVAAGLKGTRAIERFEKGKNWPRDLERIVAAYAEVAGLADTLEPWNVALDLWREHGALPLLSRREEQSRERRTQVETVKNVLEQARRTRHTAPAEPSRKSTATPKRQATR
jgi:transcriptional regulator with XRE-family HTH domain